MNTQKTGYSLVEALIIVAFITVVSFIVSPAFVFAWHSARTSQLDRYVDMMRKQIERYQYDHGGRGPHLNERGELDTEGMIDRLTGSTYTSGKLNKLGPCGPYIYDWPANPFCHSSVARAVKFGWGPVPPRDGSSGWYYNIDTCQISSNSAGPEEYVAPDVIASAEPVGELYQPASKSLGVRLTGIFNGPDGMVAFINNVQLRVGDTINGANVVKITWDTVVLELDDHREILRLPSHPGQEIDVRQPADVVGEDLREGRRP